MSLYRNSVPLIVTMFSFAITDVEAVELLTQPVNVLHTVLVAWTRGVMILGPGVERFDSYLNALFQFRHDKFGHGSWVQRLRPLCRWFVGTHLPWTILRLA